MIIEREYRFESYLNCFVKDLVDTNCVCRFPLLNSRRIVTEKSSQRARYILYIPNVKPTVGICCGSM